MTLRAWWDRWWGGTPEPVAEPVIEPIAEPLPIVAEPTPEPTPEPRPPAKPRGPCRVVIVVYDNGRPPRILHECRGDDVSQPIKEKGVRAIKRTSHVRGDDSCSS